MYENVWGADMYPKGPASLAPAFQHGQNSQIAKSLSKASDAILASCCRGMHGPVVCYKSWRPPPRYGNMPGILPHYVRSQWCPLSGSCPNRNSADLKHFCSSYPYRYCFARRNSIGILLRVDKSYHPYHFLQSNHNYDLLHRPCHCRHCALVIMSGSSWDPSKPKK